MLAGPSDTAQQSELRIQNVLAVDICFEKLHPKAPIGNAKVLRLNNILRPALWCSNICHRVSRKAKPHNGLSHVNARG